MSEPFLAEIKIMGFNFAPRNFAMCDGQILPINQNQSLFSLLGTTYGGDGRTSFALPDLRGRSPRHVGDGSLGVQAGEEAHQLAT
ncbi:MAG: tail fiber protein, partial [Gammaproteobacteria bacterium]|nr:tail fiber protein [Gammaproteobacteria bacterium]